MNIYIYIYIYIFRKGCYLMYSSQINLINTHLQEMIPLYLYSISSYIRFHNLCIYMT